MNGIMMIAFRQAWKAGKSPTDTFFEWENQRNKN